MPRDLERGERLDRIILGRGQPVGRDLATETSELMPGGTDVGAMPLPSLPLRYASIDRWLRTPAPTIGQHNEAVLCGILGLSPDELRDLEAENVIGTRPVGL